MNTPATAAVLLACLGTGVLYGTDIFCAVVLRPAAPGAREASIADLVGRRPRVRTAPAAGSSDVTGSKTIDVVARLDLMGVAVLDLFDSEPRTYGYVVPMPSLRR